MRQKYWPAIILMVVLGGWHLTPVAAAETQVRFSLGSAAFLDELIPFDHFLVGGAVRFYLTPHLSVEPEFLYMRGPETDRDYILASSLAYDLGKSDQFRFYVVGGAGLLHHTEKFPGAPDPDYSVDSWTASGGIGAQIFLTDRIFVAPEFRLGWEPLFRITGSIGYAF